MCNCGNKKCKVAALSAKTDGLKAAAEANPRGTYSWKPTRPERTYRSHMDRLGAATQECNDRQAILAVGPRCPFCLRLVAPYGADVSADACWVDGVASWRGMSWSRPGLSAADNRQNCLRLAWVLLTSPQPAAPPPQ
jgi:hypothetical protein